MKKFFGFVIGAIYIMFVGFEFKMALANYNFEPKICADKLFSNYLVPLPGIMNNWSWLGLATWLIIGLFLGRELPAKIRGWGTFLALASGLAFGVTTVIADSRCRVINQCGTQLMEVSERVYNNALMNLDKSACVNIQPMMDKCQGQAVYKTKTECEKIINDIIVYKTIGIETKECLRKKTDCYNEYLNYFYNNLTDNKETANEQCIEKYGTYNKASDYCRNYVEEWNKKGEKPRGL